MGRRGLKEEKKNTRQKRTPVSALLSCCLHFYRNAPSVQQESHFFFPVFLRVVARGSIKTKRACHIHQKNPFGNNSK